MISDRDIYADKYGRITNDPAEFALQVAVKGCFVDDRVVRRYGIADVLISTDEPRASRRVTGRNEASVKIIRSEDKEAEVAPQPQEPQEPADAVEPKADEAKPEAKKPTAKKEK